MIGLGIGIGLSVNIFVGLLIQSLQNDLIDTTVGTRPHITVNSLAENQLIPEWQDMVSKIDEISGITKIVAVLDVNAYIMSVHPESPDSVLLRGFDFESANKLYDFYDTNTFVGQKPTNVNDIIVGSVLLEDLGLQIGDKLVIKSDPNPIKPNTTVTITGVFDLGSEQVNKSWIIGSTQLVRSISGITNEITSINIQVKDIFKADSIANEVRQKLNNPNVEVVDWKQTNKQLLSGLAAQAQSSAVIIFFVLLAVGVSIASILSITVMQKSKQIGILKAMGLTDFRSAMIFLTEGLFLGFLGSAIGVLIGLFLIYGFNTFARNPDAGIFSIVIDSMYILRSVLIALVFAAFASIIPAKRSSSMEVIDIIRSN